MTSVGLMRSFMMHADRETSGVNTSFLPRKPDQNPSTRV